MADLLVSDGVFGRCPQAPEGGPGGGVPGAQPHPGARGLLPGVGGGEGRSILRVSSRLLGGVVQFFLVGVGRETKTRTRIRFGGHLGESGGVRG